MATATERPPHVRCKECGLVKPRSQMERSWRNAGWCNDCRNAYRRRKWAETNPERKRFPRREGDLWRCGDCLAMKPIDGFYVRDRGNGPEATAYCRECVRERGRARTESYRKEVEREAEAWRAWTRRLP